MSQLTFAKVIELDNQNTMHCETQLRKGSWGWERNVLMLYVKGSPGTDEFRAIYEQIASEYPERNLFALNVFNPEADVQENQLIWKTVKACLTDMWYRREEDMGYINTKTPAYLLCDYAAAKIGLGDHELSTKEDIIKFIGEHRIKAG